MRAAEREIELRWGRGTVPCPVEEGWDVLLPPAGGAAGGAEELFLAAAAEPAGCAPLAEMLEGARTVTVVVSDATRKTGFHRYSHLLRKFMEDAGVREVRTLVAVGTHRPPTAEEVRAITGPGWFEGGVEAHDCDASPFAALGVTSRGTPVEVNRAAVECDLLVLTGEAKYHYFAGFGGGRKAVLPGVSSRASITANHSLSFLGPEAENAALGRLEGNPVHEDMDEALEMLPVPVFLVNAITAADGGVLEVHAGDAREAFLAACEAVRRRFDAPIPRRYRTVIASAGGYPADINPTQSHKSFDFASRALEEGGTLVLAAAMPDEGGLSTLAEWLALPDRREHVRRLEEEFVIGGRTALAWRDKLERAGEVWLVSSLDERATASLGMRKARSVAEALERAAVRPPVAVMPFASLTNPVVRA